MDELQHLDTGRAWRAGQWLCDEALEPMHEINARCLDVLRTMSQQTTTGAGQGGLDADWRSLSPMAQSRLACIPYLLVDAGFNDELRWLAVARRSVQDLPRRLLEPAFTGEGAHEFVHDVLVYAWHLARAHRQVARLVLGLSPACAAPLASLRLRDLEWLAAEQPGWVRPRWERQPAIWRHLLRAAREDDRQLLTQVSLRGIQLLAAGVLGPQPSLARASPPVKARI